MQPAINSRYDDAKSWCNELIQTGNSCLFDKLGFEDEMKTASVELGFPMEVRLLTNYCLTDCCCPKLKLRPNLTHTKNSR
jgi:hypothetical protein